jgi:peptide deformylase
MTILQYPHQALDVKCTPVDKVTPELVATAKEMLQVMKDSNGIGLAANQVGLDIRLIVMTSKTHGDLILFNPMILKRSPETEYNSEGCLSFDNITRLIKRPLEVTVKYRNEHGKMEYVVLKGIDARCISHEIDHLQGLTFLSHKEKDNTTT